MNNIIWPSYRASVPAGRNQARQAAHQAGGFLDAVARAGGNGAGTCTSGLTAALPASQMLELRAAQGTEAVEGSSLETMLKNKYPGLHYHVFDASSGYWRTRNDYPHHLLYQDGDEAQKTLENWKPTGANPFYGSVDGKFIAPKEIHALGNVPPGSKAVVIHPKVQERMEQDPDYAQEIMAKIDTWFAFDVARNEAIRAGSTLGMSQAVAIGEDGNICNACASSSGGSITTSGDDEMVRAYRLRMAKRADFMRWVVQQQIEKKAQASNQAAAAAAKSRLAEMMSSGRLQEVFGEKIAGVPTEEVLAITRSQVWGTANR